MTGASAGIGRIYADRLAGRGYDLILIARRADLIHTAAALLRDVHGVQVQTLVADLSQPQELDRTANTIAADETVTMLVNNAGTSTLTPVDQTTVAAANAMTDINITALLRLSLAVLPSFKTRDHGAIINIGSILGFHSLPVSTIYSSTKGYVLNFTRGLQNEVVGTGITVQLVMPAATATDLWELSVSAVDQDCELVPSGYQGCRNATLLWRELKERGYRGSERTLRRWLAERRQSGVRHQEAVDAVAAEPGRSRRAADARGSWRRRSTRSVPARASS